MRAVTDDGRFVELNDDGMWKFLERTREQVAGFLNVSWGASLDGARAQLSKRYSVTELEDDGVLMLELSMVGDPCEAFLRFSRGIFVKGSITLKAEYFNSNLYVEKFDIWSSRLVEKYGEPNEVEVLWDEDADVEAPWGTALEWGDLLLRNKWRTADTDVTLGAVGGEGDCSVLISYESREFFHLAAQEEHDRLMEIL